MDQLVPGTSDVKPRLPRLVGVSPCLAPETKIDARSFLRKAGRDLVIATLLTTCCSRLVSDLSFSTVISCHRFLTRAAGRITERGRMPATSVSAAENYMPEKPRAFSETTREILPEELEERAPALGGRERKRDGEKAEGQRELAAEGGGGGNSAEEWDGTTESASSPDRAETRRNGRAITLPG